MIQIVMGISVSRVFLKRIHGALPVAIKKWLGFLQKEGGKVRSGPAQWFFITGKRDFSEKKKYRQKKS